MRWLLFGLSPADQGSPCLGKHLRGTTSTSAKPPIAGA